MARKQKNWLIRVYSGDRLVDKWVVENRTENEALKETESEIVKESQLQEKDFDWTMTVVKSRKKLKKVM